MAEAGSWPSIQRYGLLSTSALLDLFNVRGSARAPFESAHRPESMMLTHPDVGTAVVRDQKPMSDRGLIRCLEPGLTPRDWYALLNSKVFFWLDEARLARLLGARAYRNRDHAVLVLDSASLIAAHSTRAVLSPINSGCTVPYPRPRGRDTFLPLDSYPFARWVEKRRGKDPVVELAIEGGVQDASAHVIEVRSVQAGGRARVVWRRTA
jgi:hypothetical protein